MGSCSLQVSHSRGFYQLSTDEAIPVASILAANDRVRGAPWTLVVYADVVNYLGIEGLCKDYIRAQYGSGIRGPF